MEKCSVEASKVSVRNLGSSDTMVQTTLEVASDEFWIRRISGFSQLFIKRINDGIILLILAKFKADILITGSIANMKSFAS